MFRKLNKHLKGANINSKQDKNAQEWKLIMACHMAQLGRQSYNHNIDSYNNMNIKYSSY